MSWWVLKSVWQLEETQFMIELRNVSGWFTSKLLCNILGKVLLAICLAT